MSRWGPGSSGVHSVPSAPTLRLRPRRLVPAGTRARCGVEPGPTATNGSALASPSQPRAPGSLARSSPPAPTAAAAAISRRSALLGTLLATGGSLAAPGPSRASLVRFPADQLNNRYFLVRAGESYAESVGEPLTNPVWKTSERHGLSALGKEQVLLGLLPSLERMGACADGCWLWPSITQNAYQTAEVLAYRLSMGRSRIVPEYSFLDPRGLGALENVRLQAAQEAVVAGDLLDPGWRPLRGARAWGGLMSFPHHLNGPLKRSR
ncbi:hypothetical protein TSOC_007380 [Tetrabaena socialis]|uniref:Uncharacterized protein n=1 Tax=Tetrabaena socialis TaxID=47790 RepID=A0A2J8A191_9CHLO|nr:hypothetical protein TSOC_007380 [Tetrabaena socialis]|eukprot:PNH06265.1 hypothetical protein TSOC_007380 [Tetrabaena socialis]